MLKKGLFKNIFVLILSITFILIGSAPLYAIGFSWSGSPISGEAGQENPNFFPAGTASFDILSSTDLRLTLTYTGSSEPLSGIAQVLTGLTWDMDGFLGTLTATSALIAPGSSLILDPGSFSGTDLSGQWAFKDDISASSALGEPLGIYGVGAIGDINFGEDTFGSLASGEIIDPSKNQVTPVPNGVDFGLVPFGTLPSNGGFQNQGPLVQNAMYFDFIFDGTLTEDMFANVVPLFGSEGATPVPEPATMLLIGTGLAGLIGMRRKLKK
jgi:hypothetical protein